MEDLVTLSESLEEDDAPAKGDANVLDLLRSKLEAEIQIPLVEVEVPKRPGVTIVFKPQVSSSQLRSWQKRCTNKRGELDNLRFSSMVIVAMSEGMKVDGQWAMLDNGDEMQINSQEFADMMSVVPSDIVPHGIKNLFGIDAHVEATALRLLDEAGYGDSLDVEDPTKES